jgi:ActR/RegA family two-component response regulator
MDVYTTAVKSAKDSSQSNDDKLSRIAAKPEGPMLGASGSSPVERAASITPGNEEKHASLLLVDDEEHILRLMKRLFSKVAFEAADSLSSALSVVEQMKDCKVLLTDFNLSAGETAIPLIKRVRERFPNAKVIVVSGRYDNAVDEIDGTGMKDVRVFPKPFSVTDIVDAVMGSL